MIIMFIIEQKGSRFDAPLHLVPIKVLTPPSLLFSSFIKSMFMQINKNKNYKKRPNVPKFFLVFLAFIERLISYIFQDYYNFNDFFLCMCMKPFFNSTILYERTFHKQISFLLLFNVLKS